MSIRHAVVAMAVSCMCASALAVEYKWANTSSGNDVFSMYQWSDPANWQNSAAPSGTSSDIVTFTNAPTGVRWIGGLPDDVSMASIIMPTSKKTYLVGGTLNVSSTIGVGGQTGSEIPRIYADINVLNGSGLYFSTYEICGDLYNPNHLNVFQASGNTWFRMDLYANEAGEVRENPLGLHNASMGWGHFHFIAPQGSDDDIVATWTLTEGSRFATRPSGTAAHALCVGTIVTAAGDALPAGTFLKRIFDDGTIELSQPASAGGDVALTFAAFSPKLSCYTYQVNQAVNTTPHELDISKYREKDSFRFCTRWSGIGPDPSDPTGEKNMFRINATTGIPGTFVISNFYDFGGAFVMKLAHVEIGGHIDMTGRAHGLPNAARVRLYDSSSKARVTVVDGVNAVFNNFMGIYGAFTKDGPGTLTLKMTNSYNSAGTLLNTGSIAVNEGAVSFVEPPDGKCGVNALSISSDATVQLPEGGLSVNSFSFESGATLSGPGNLYVDISSAASLAGLNLVNGAKVVYAASTANGEPIYDYPKGSVPGSPALWMRADAGLVTEATDSPLTNKVVRWNDCRGDGYLFATNVASVYPTVQTNSFGAPYVRFAQNSAASKTEIENTAALVWSEPVTNICVVFLVDDVREGGGTALGSSPRIATHDFYRSQEYSYWNRIIEWSCEKVRTGQTYLNGVFVDTLLSNTGYPGGEYIVSGAIVSRPIVIEFIPSAPVEADCFGFCNNQNGCNGRKRTHECIVYTNSLTQAERIQVEEYLMNKYLKGHANYKRLADVTNAVSSVDVAVASALTVPDGGRSAVLSLSGTGSFEKTGAGELYVDDFVAPNAAVTVSGGTLSVRSVRTDESNLPATPYLHVDASDSSTWMLKEGVDGAVRGLKDKRGDGYPNAITRYSGTFPIVTPSEVGGLSMVDFGEAKYDSVGYPEAFKLQLNGVDTRTEALRSTVAVIGTSQGGGFLAGEVNASRSYNMMGGLWRAWTNSTMTIIATNVTITRPTSIQATTEKGGLCRGRLNGVDMIPAKTGFSGGYDLVSFASIDCFGMSGLCACHYGSRVGGQELGEQMFFEENLSREQMLSIESYLKRKWYGVEEPGFRGASAASLAVADGATVAVYGNSPFTVGALAGSGTVDGAVKLANNGQISVVVASDGSVEALDVGSLALGDAATIAFSGDVRKLARGGHEILRSESIEGMSGCTWTVTGLPGARTASVSATAGALVVDVVVPGLVITVD